jgi:NAD(P)-dependent dehydrogenase (short-subunit alcohol dehydrogenase family)
MHILVTGGSGGLGKRIAQGLFMAGHTVTTMGRDNCDISCELEYIGDINTALGGRIGFDAVIHCAGENYIAPHNDLQIQDIERLFMVNAVSNFHINRILLNRGLQIACHIISDAAWTPMTHSLAYNVSKAAQLMVMRQMAHEIKPDKCIIFGVSPGKIADTDMSKYIDNTFPALRGMTYEEGRKYQASRLKTGEMSPDTVANFVKAIFRTISTHYHGQNFTIGG